MTRPPELTITSTPVTTGARPLTGPAVGTAIALAAFAAHVLALLAASWTAYHELVAYSMGTGPDQYEMPSIVRAAEVDFPFGFRAFLAFGCAVAFLAAWVVRARRNAGDAVPDRSFRFSPALAVVAVLLPVVNLVLVGPVIAEIAAASRPPAARRRPVLDLVWWFGVLVAVLGLVAAGAAVEYTPIGSSSEGDGPVNELPTPAEVSAQLAVAGFRTVAAVGLVVGVVGLVLLMVRIGRWQASAPPAAPSGTADVTADTAVADTTDEPAGRRGSAAVRMAVAAAATAAALLALLTTIRIVDVASYSWTGLGEQFLVVFVIPALALEIGQVVVLCVAAVRFRRRPRRSATALAVVACAVAWLRLLLPTGAESDGLGFDPGILSRLALVGCLVTAFAAVWAARSAATGTDSS